MVCMQAVHSRLQTKMKQPAATATGTAMSNFKGLTGLPKHTMQMAPRQPASHCCRILSCLRVWACAKLGVPMHAVQCWLTCTAARTSMVSGYMCTMDLRPSSPALSSSVVLSLPSRTSAVEPMDRLILMRRLSGVSLPAATVAFYAQGVEDSQSMLGITKTQRIG